MKCRRLMGMTPYTQMSQGELESQVQRQLRADEPIDQSEFVKSISEEVELDQQQVLGVLRTLMERDKVSYTLDYNLQTEDDL